MKQESFKETFKRRGVIPISAIPLKHKIPDNPQKWGGGAFIPFKKMKLFEITKSATSAVNASTKTLKDAGII